MELRTRQARPADTARIAEIHVEASRAAFTGLLPKRELDALCPRQMARRWAPLTLTHDGGFYVAEENQVVGFCLVTRARGELPDNHAAEIMAIYVDPERHSAGIGTRLMDIALDHASIRGFTEIMLWVLPGNERARRFHESFGFSSNGVEHAHHGLRTKTPHLEYRRPLLSMSTSEPLGHESVKGGECYSHPPDEIPRLRCSKIEPLA